mgnify:CR=1 FL=1
MQTSANGSVEHPEIAPTAIAAGGSWREKPAEQVVQECRRLIDQEGLVQAQMARDANVKSTTLSQVLNNRYPGKVEPVVEKLAAYLDERDGRAAFRPEQLESPGFFATPTAETALARIQISHFSQRMAIVVGIPGAGKTMSAREYARRAPHNAWYVYLSEFCASKLDVLMEIATAIGVEIPKGNHANKIFKAICERLRGSRGVLLIDEAHHADRKALDGLRAIHDVAGIAIVLLANEQLHARINSGSGRQDTFAQFTSRVCIKHAIAKITEGDVAAQAKAWGVSDRECLKVLKQIAKKPGGMRAIDATLHQATWLARAGESAITPEILREAYASHDQGGL